MVNFTFNDRKIFHVIISQDYLATFIGEDGSQILTLLQLEKSLDEIGTKWIPDDHYNLIWHPVKLIGHTACKFLGIYSDAIRWHCLINWKPYSLIWHPVKLIGHTAFKLLGIYSNKLKQTRWAYTGVLNFLSLFNLFWFLSINIDSAEYYWLVYFKICERKIFSCNYFSNTTWLHCEGGVHKELLEFFGQVLLGYTGGKAEARVTRIMPKDEKILKQFYN